MFLVHYLIFYSYIIVHNVTHMWRTKICDAQNFVTHKNFLLFLPLFKLIWNLRIHFTIIYLWVCTTWKKYSLQNIWQKNSQRYGIFSGPFFCKRPKSYLQNNGPNGGLMNSAFLKSFPNFLLVLEVAYYNVFMLFIMKT